MEQLALDFLLFTELFDRSAALVLRRWFGRCCFGCGERALALRLPDLLEAVDYPLLYFLEVFLTDLVDETLPRFMVSA